MSSSLTIDQIMSAFVGRRDRVGLMMHGERPVSVKVTEEEFRIHLQQHVDGNQRVGIYNLMDGDAVRFAVIDFDSHGADDEKKAQMEEASARCQKDLEQAGIKCHREISKGGRGNYHIWIFFSEAESAATVRTTLTKFLKGRIPDGITVEIFPKQGSLRGGVGNFVWLPFFPPDTRIGKTVFVNLEGNVIDSGFECCDFSAFRVEQHEFDKKSESNEERKQLEETPIDLLARCDIPEGERHNSLIRIVGHLRAKGLLMEEALAHSRNWNRLLVMPLPEKEIEDTVRSLYSVRESDEEHLVDVSGFAPMSLFQLSEILGMTIKRDNVNKVVTFLVGLTIYTEDSQLNLCFNAPSSAGKSFIPLEIARLFPRSDVLEVGYCSPTSFFHDHGPFDKEKGGFVMDISRKLIVFLDQPRSDLLERLRPMLSHDKKEILLKITDKSQKSGQRTKNIYVRGYPAVIFCTASSKMDEQEITRLILLSPELTQEKIRQSIIEKILRESNPTHYQKRVETNPQWRMLKDRVRAIKQAGITEIRIDDEEYVRERFFSQRNTLVPRHQRDIGKAIGLVRSIALLNLWWRKREGDILFASSEDIDAAFDLWDSISLSQEMNVAPYLLDFCRNV